ncbi:MAG: hypothetical protein AAFZ80_11930 [Cyanobacteria bacterium P01_A01_bin.105]
MTVSPPRPPISAYRTPLFDWTPDEYRAFGQAPHRAHHRYHELPLFTDEGLIDLLDRYPREHLQAFTMGTDPTYREDWTCVDIDLTSTGEDILNAVKRGRLWLNLIKIESFNQDYADLIEGMYEKIDANCPHLGGIRGDYSALLIASPQSILYYHLDAAPNMLWNMRGHEKVWAYPAMDPRLAPQDFLEDIYAGEIDEEMPYESWFDQYAQCFTLEPGDVMWWPRNAPHRLEYPDLNVSITTSYYTPSLRERDMVLMANRFILRNLGFKNRSNRETGVRASLKRLTYKAINKVRPFKAKDSTASYVTDLQLDPNEPNGYRYLEHQVVPAFGNLKERMM